MMKQQSNFKKYNDALHDLKQFAVDEPNLKAVVRNFGATPVVILLEPALKKEFAHHHHLYEVADYFGDFAKIFVTGLVGAKGDDWKKQRKIISQSFHFEFIKENVPIILQTTRSKLKELSQKSLEKTNILEEMEGITSETVGKIFFSENLSSYQINGKPVGTYLADTLENVGKSFISVGYLLFGPKYIEKGLWASHRKVLAEVKLLEDTCKKILSDRKKANVQHKDLAWYLLETQKNANEEDRLSDDIIISNYVTFIMVLKFIFPNLRFF
jgi:cytochrome P450